jgi:hypothetical protein
MGRSGIGYAARLVPEDILNLADLFLDFAGYFLVSAFGFPFRFHAEFPIDLPGLTLCFVQLAPRLVLRAVSPGIPRK